MKTDDLIKYALIIGAAYIVWQYVLMPMMATPSTVSAATAAANPTTTQLIPSSAFPTTTSVSAPTDSNSLAPVFTFAGSTDGVVTQ